MIGNQIQGTYQLSGVDKNDEIVVEIWVVLQDTIQSGASGNVPSALESAFANGDTQDVSGGKQTVPLLKLQEFFTASADVSIVKSDSPDPVTGGSELAYTITVTNNSADTVANLVQVSEHWMRTPPLCPQRRIRGRVRLEREASHVTLGR